MDIEDLVKLSEKDIKNNPEHLRLYIDFYKGVFGYKPSCTKCTFRQDLNKLKKKVLTLETNPVSNKKITKMKYILKKGHSSKILSYNYKGATHRIYGRDLNDAFAEAFLTYGTKTQIAERELMFDVLPKKEEPVKVEVEPVKVEVEEPKKKKATKKSK